MLKRATLILFILILSWASYSHANELEARAVVESTEVYKGQSFAFQIRVSGSENPEQPNLSSLNDFSVQYLGGSQNSSSSITIINGKMTKEEKKGYIFNYQFAPLNTGNIIIPAIEIRSGNNVTQTPPIVIAVKEPSETEDFKLRLRLSKDACYVGEPLILTVTWYIGMNVQDFNFNLPVVSDNRFNFADHAIDKQEGKQLYRIQLGDEEAIGEKGSGELDGKKYTTMTFKKVLIPKESGTIRIEQATVSCRALEGYSRRRNDSFSDFFDDDFFSSSRRAIYKTVVVPSNSLTLKVRDLPEDGKPYGFSGHIGKYKIETSASPLGVNVGDPITLTMAISGPEYLDHVELPSLKDQADFKNNFKIPEERASAEVQGKTKVFTQTIRPLNSSVKEIPPVDLSYFDSDKGKYSIARSNPIPLIVHETRIVTLLDAEGASEVQTAGNDIETSGKGIAFNYEDMSVLDKQYLTPLACFKEGLWPVLVFSPPLVFILLLTGVAINRKRNSDPLKVLSRKAYGNLKKTLEKAESASPDGVCELVLDSFREYLGVKLKMPSGGAATFEDVRQELESSGVEQDITERLKRMFESCEAGRYAGNITFKNSSSLIDEGISIARHLEKRLK
ncbi:BatD family protein [Thermodesulfobacteriota bacterium]